MVTEIAGNDIHADSALTDRNGRDVFAPQHSEVGVDHLRARREVQPDLKELHRIGAIGTNEGEHLGVHDPGAGGQPLNVALAVACGCSQRVGVIYEASPHDGHGLESPVRMLRESGHLATVIHAPTVEVRRVDP